MRCDQARELLGAHLDGELDAKEANAVADHAASCAACAREAGDITRLGRQIRAAARIPAPAGLEATLRDMAARGAAAAPGPEAASAPMRVQRRGARMLAMPGLRAAASLAGVALVSSLLTFGVMTRLADRAELDREILTAHIRSLLMDAPTQVASSNQHTVKPWFAGRVDFAPDVKDLSAEGFPLLGARLDYVAGRRVGALVYKRRLHVINVFAWAAPAGPETERTASANGYNYVTWTRNGIVYWAVSDLNLGELRQLKGLL